jgi:protoheme IX farnesyltransferase
LSLVLWTTLGGWLMASGSHSINCYLDKDIDVNMGRTGRRPIPSGRIPAWHALALGIALGVVAFVILASFVNLLAAMLALAGFLYYVFIYTIWLKRTSKHNIVIGGGAGAFPPLVGWAAVAGSLAPEALLLWLIVFFWTPPHFWALALIRQKDYARAGVPMLPVVEGDQETRRQIVIYTLFDAGAHGAASVVGDARMGLPAERGSVRRPVPALCAQTAPRRNDHDCLGAVQVFAALPGDPLRGDGGGSCGVCVMAEGRTVNAT